ncbi:helix-turn-helix transcriptional regulator [Candidatus Fukatsuia symbiotica]|uniref:helix-turn-helix transcriptional regulator n=1 Tax=Candidatus Fukatsuia TaxID=1927833 RepID=UPI001F0805AD|nr:helix-turn-helix transcriptional regulator [Candidatus Fukatsuia symbiotica]MEA9444466.1 helix-turn-helix transcriptional regulator [Candidatus Fukatsuia symbiotica]
MFNFQEHDRNVIERQENLASLDIYPYGSEEIIQPYICEKFPLRSEDREKIGIIFQIKKPLFLTPLICCSKKQSPKSLVSYPPDDSFTNRELEVIFFSIQRKSSKEIGKILSLSYRTIENMLRVIYQKAGVHFLGQFIEFCEATGFNRYIPPRLLCSGSQLLNIK